MYDYTLELGWQRAKVRDGAFHWTMPENTGGHVRLRFTGYYGEEVAVIELPVVQAGDPVEPPLPGGEQLHLPKMIQSEEPLPVFGPFDGDSSTTSVEIGGERCRVLAEVPGRAIAEGTHDHVGVTPYVIRKGVSQATGETRIVKIRQTLPPIPQDHAKSGILRVHISGLDGAKENIPIKFEILFPQTGNFEPRPPYQYFGSHVQYRFVQPKEIKAGGFYVTERTVLRSVEGPLRATATLMIPQNLRDLVEMVLRTPRENYLKTPEEEHAEALQSYGDAVMPILAEFTLGELFYEAFPVLFEGPQHGAPWLLPRLSGTGTSLDYIVRAYADVEVADAAFAYKKELHATCIRLLERKSTEAIYALGKIGTADDIPVLEHIYQQAQTPQGHAVAIASEAALARMGVKEHIDNIVRQIIGPDQRWYEAVKSAVYTDRTEMIPPLCKHIHDPSRWISNDQLDSPSLIAEMAILDLQHRLLKLEELEVFCKATIQ